VEVGTVHYSDVLFGQKMNPIFCTVIELITLNMQVTDILIYSRTVVCNQVVFTVIL